MADTHEKPVREIVIPGDLLSAGGHRSGQGTYKLGGNIYASMLGIKRVRGNVVEVVPLSGKYVPQKGHTIIGKVIDIGPSFWVIDLNSPFIGILHVNDTRWKVGFDETSKFLEKGAYIICAVSEIEKGGKALVSLRFPGCRKIDKGTILTVQASRVPRIIGKDGSMIEVIKKGTGCQIFVGKNGRVWLDGTSDSITLAIEAIRMVESEAPTLGLTERVSAYLRVHGSHKDGQMSIKPEKTGKGE